MKGEAKQDPGVSSICRSSRVSLIQPPLNYKRRLYYRTNFPAVCSRCRLLLGRLSAVHLEPNQRLDAKPSLNSSLPVFLPADEIRQMCGRSRCVMDVCRFLLRDWLDEGFVIRLSLSVHCLLLLKGCSTVDNDLRRCRRGF